MLQQRHAVKRRQPAPLAPAGTGGRAAARGRTRKLCTCLARYAQPSTARNATWNAQASHHSDRYGSQFATRRCTHTSEGWERGGHRAAACGWGMHSGAPQARQHTYPKEGLDKAVVCAVGLQRRRPTQRCSTRTSGRQRQRGSWPCLRTWAFSGITDAGNASVPACRLLPAGPGRLTDAGSRQREREGSQEAPAQQARMAGQRRRLPLLLWRLAALLLQFSLPRGWQPAEGDCAQPQPRGVGVAASAAVPAGLAAHRTAAGSALRQQRGACRQLKRRSPKPSRRSTRSARYLHAWRQWQPGC